MAVRMDLARIIIRETGDSQIIVLKEREGSRHFPILIGIYEALAIQRRIKGEPTQRPLTHELMSRIIEGLNGELERIVISDLKDHTFFATIVIRRNGEMVSIDSRPSDAIALGAATNAPIFVEEQVLRAVCLPDEDEPDV